MAKTENSENDSGATEKDEAKRPVVTLEDFLAAEFETPIAEIEEVGFHKLQGAFNEAAKKAEQSGDHKRATVYALLSTICSFHYRPEDRANPYGPQWVMNDRRSAQPSDFRGQQSSVFAQLAPLVKNPLLRARLADTAWLNDKKEHEAARLAIEGIVSAIRLVGDSNLKFEFGDSKLYSSQGQEKLRRALSLSRAIGWDKPASLLARNLAIEIKDKAIADKNLSGFGQTSKLDLDFGVSDPSAIAAESEAFARTAVGEKNFEGGCQMWELAARAHSSADNEKESERCVVEVADCYSKMADSLDSAMIQTNFLMRAIETLRQVRGTRERREQLQVRLVAAQQNIHEEMQRISHPLDLSKVVKATEKQFDQLPFGRALGDFACLDNSPDPDQLRREALEQAEKHPLSTIIPMSVHDHEGKLVAKSAGLAETESEDEAIKFQISRNEAMRRQILVAGSIEIARRSILSRYLVTQDDFLPLVRVSPFVPLGHEIIFARGFSHFFSGNFMEAAHLLVPQIENSLRYILLQSGADVSTITSDMTQENVTLSTILGRFRPLAEKIFGKEIIFDIDLVFDFPGGPTIRHSLAHGLLDSSSFRHFDVVYACWLIFRLCCIPLFGQWDKIVKFYEAQE